MVNVNWDEIAPSIERNELFAKMQSLDDWQKSALLCALFGALEYTDCYPILKRKIESYY